MKTAIIIPARIGSTRLARKPLRMIAGVSLLERVYRQCNKAKGIDRIFIATDSEEIAAHCKSFGAEVVMTSENCANGTERVIEAAKHLDESFEIVINVQGDEPLVEPSVIENITAAFSDPSVMIATPIAKITNEQDIKNSNIVKVVTDANNNILYFSRSAIPFTFSEHPSEYQRHIGLYGFRRSILDKLSRLPSSPLEESERLEQLRWLYHGYRVRAIRTDYNSVEVNTEEDIRQIEAILGV